MQKHIKYVNIKPKNKNKIVKAETHEITNIRLYEI